MSNEKSLTKILTNMDVNLNQTERLISGIAGGGLLAYGIKRGDTAGAALAVVGGLLGLRGATGHCQIKHALEVGNGAVNGKANNGKSFTQNWLSGKVEVKKAVTIDKSQAELFAFWRNFENLPQFMNHLESVVTVDDTRSYWKAKAPLGYSVEWQAEITDEVSNEKIAWRSLDGSDISNKGSVEFRPTANRGTEVVVHITYEAPAGKIGALAAKIFGEEPNQQVAEDLRRFKRLMEAGLIMSIEGQPSGREAQGKSKSEAA